VVEVAASLVAPAEVAGGAAFEVDWEGPNNPGDYVSVVPAGASEGHHLSRAYTGRGSPARLTAPDEPGDYEVRYVNVLAQSARTLVSERIRIVEAEVAASVLVPADVAAGVPFEVDWQGPNHPGDYITIAPVGAPEGHHLSRAYTGRGSPVRLTAPREPGDYEVRYVLGQGNRTLVSERVRIGEAEVAAGAVAPAEIGPSVVSPAEVAPAPGSRWTGRGRTTPETMSPSCRRRRRRDVSFRGRTPAAAAPPALPRPASPATTRCATCSARGTARWSANGSGWLIWPPPWWRRPKWPRGAAFEVDWQGPNNSGDYITIVLAGRPEGTYLSWAYTSRGSPARLHRAREPGDYEVRYVLGQGTARWSANGSGLVKLRWLPAQSRRRWQDCR
jgi:Ca-activated chloride channel homolog